MNRRSVGLAFSDHVFEEKIKRRRGFSGSTSEVLLRFVPIIFLIIAFIALSLRLFTLQIVRASYYSRLSDENRIRTVLIPAPRGIIFDRNGIALVRNTPSFSKLVKDGKSKNKKIEWFNRDEALKRIAKGENIIATPRREYLYKEAFSHVLGYIGQISSDESLRPEFSDYGLSDFTGRMGIEEQYEKILHGDNGRELYEVDAKGNTVRLLGKDSPREGSVIKTALDSNMQIAAFNAMKNLEKGAIVVTDPRDGSILALYSKPSFDPNLFTREDAYIPEGDYKTKEEILLDNSKFPLLNRAITGVYPPGSTYKLITSLAALEDKAIVEDTEIEDTGIISAGGSTFGTWNFLQNGRKEGLLDLRGAIRRSNDIFFYRASEKIGEDKLADWSKKLGLGELTGIDLPGEVKGTVPDTLWKKKILNENWYLGDTYNMSIGQGYLETTPLQVNLYTQIIANGGEMYRPHIIKDGVKLMKKDFLTDVNMAIIRDGMKQACEPGGTGYPLFNFKVKNNNLKIDGLDYVDATSGSAKMTQVTLGCKTGTSEAHGFKQEPHAWFTTFAPFYNPEIVVTVLVENGGEGSSVAAPVAKDILKAYFEKKN